MLITTQPWGVGTVLSVAALIAAVVFPSPAMGANSFFDAYVDLDGRSALPASVAVGKRSKNAVKIAARLPTPCFRVTPSKVGFRFFPANSGYVGEACAEKNCFKVHKERASTNSNKWRAYKCKDSKGKRCWAFAKCVSCNGRLKWIKSQYGVQFKISDVIGGGVVAIDSCPDKCFNFVS